jgi:PAS domain S-box-containing protein
MAVLAGLQASVAAGFVLLALVVVRDWIRERDPSRAALAAAISLLAGVSVIGQLNAYTDYRMARALAPVNLVAFAASGYAFLLFRHTMIRLSRPILVAAGAATLAVAAAVIAVRLPVGPMPRYTTRQLAAVLALVVVWSVDVGEPAVRFWLVSRPLPSVQRARLHALSAAYAMIIVVLFVSLLGGSVERAGTSFRAVVSAVTLALLPLLYVSFAPPRWLRRTWRARDDEALRDAMSDLLSSEDRRQLAARSLDWAMRLMGTDAAFVRDHDGFVLAEQGSDASDIDVVEVSADDPEPRLMRLDRYRIAISAPLDRRGGIFSVISGPLTPLFGTEEIRWFAQYVATVSTALDRARLLSEIRASEQSLVEAQTLAHVGSWRTDLRTGTRTWTREQYAIFGLDADAPPPDDDAIYALIHPADRDWVRAASDEMLRTNEPLTIDYRIVPRAGDTRWVQARARIETDATTGEQVAVIGTVQDITEPKHRESREALLGAIVRSSDDSIIAVDREGLITTWNAGAEHLYGWTGEEAIGSPYARLWPPDRQQEGNRIRDRVLAGESIEHYQTRRMRKDGSLVDVSFTASPIRDELGQVIGVSSISRDIGPQRRVEEALRQALEHERTAAERLREADKLKDEFLATVSHELRTPLALIVGFADVLGGSWWTMDDDKRLDLVRRIDNAAASMTQLIEQLLDFSRLQAGRVRLAPRLVELRRSVEDVVSKLPEVGAAHEIAIDIPADVQVEADPQGLERILGNLLSNAAKFSPHGSEIAVSAQDGDGIVRVSVRDRGVGISSTELPLVFERFYQVATATSSHKGSGLGLAIAKRYVELSGGSIWAESSPGRGSTFSFTLPRARSD